VEQTIFKLGVKSESLMDSHTGDGKWVTYAC